MLGCEELGHFKVGHSSDCGKLANNFDIAWSVLNDALAKLWR